MEAITVMLGDRRFSIPDRLVTRSAGHRQYLLGYRHDHDLAPGTTAPARRPNSAGAVTAPVADYLGLMGYRLHAHKPSRPVTTPRRDGRSGPRWSPAGLAAPPRSL